jgi:hypothetical protein
MMNKRIREIAWANGCRAHKFTKGAAIYPNVDEDLERFALAIIQVCAKLASEETSLPYDSYSEKIKQHFGVEL